MLIQKEILLPEFTQGFHLINKYILQLGEYFPETGLINIFIKHTSAALTINENSDPKVRNDLQTAFDKLVPENESWYTHIFEGPDDMPAHIKSSLTSSSVNIPITDKKLNLGTWQGIYLCEFRKNAGRRKITVTIIS